MSLKCEGLNERRHQIHRAETTEKRTHRGKHTMIRKEMFPTGITEPFSQAAEKLL